MYLCNALPRFSLTAENQLSVCQKKYHECGLTVEWSSFNTQGYFLHTHIGTYIHTNSNMLKNNGESYRIAELAQCTRILAYIAFKQLKALNLPRSFSPPATFSAWTVVLAALVWSWGVCWHHRTWHGWAIWPGDPGVSAGDWQWQDAGLSLPLSASMGVVHKVKCRSATTPLRHTFSSFWKEDNNTKK